jgi:hypothetical protein
MMYGQRVWCLSDSQANSTVGNQKKRKEEERPAGHSSYSFPLYMISYRGTCADEVYRDCQQLRLDAGVPKA